MSLLTHPDCVALIRSARTRMPAQYALSDWLREHGDDERAEYLRVQGEWLAAKFEPKERAKLARRLKQFPPELRCWWSWETTPDPSWMLVQPSFTPQRACEIFAALFKLHRHIWVVELRDAQSVIKRTRRGEPVPPDDPDLKSWQGRLQLDHWSHSVWVVVIDGCPMMAPAQMLRLINADTDRFTGIEWCEGSRRKGWHHRKCWATADLIRELVRNPFEPKINLDRSDNLTCQIR